MLSGFSAGQPVGVPGTTVMWRFKRGRDQRGCPSMKMRLVMVSTAVAAVSSVAFLSVAFTLAHAQPAKKVNTSPGARTAACKKDCSAGHLHGTYRAYGS